MIVNECDITVEDTILKVQATVTWEDANKPALRLFVETDGRFAASVSPDPNAFLLACLFPAWRDGERRLFVDGTVCPVLRDNLRAAVETITTWYPDRFGDCPRVEAARLEVKAPSATRALSLMSCGVDSLSILRWNQLRLPPSHPGSTRAVASVEHCRHPSQGPFSECGRFRAAAAIASCAGVDFLPVRTNVWWLADDGYFFDEVWHGALLSALTWFFSGGFHRVHIASSYAPAHLRPWGSHPLLDFNYSGAHFATEHHGLWMSRLEKTALIADWPDGMKALRVCQNDDSGTSNCGTCEKCIRTMAALAALGRLSECGAFPSHDVTAGLLQAIEDYDMFTTAHHAHWYAELVPALTERGRPDLVAGIQRLLSYSARKYGGHSMGHAV
jgi:hypothetical protein